MSLPFLSTNQMTYQQSAQIDKALSDHGIIVEDGGAYGGFDWLCDRVEEALAIYLHCSAIPKPDSRSHALAKIERFRRALSDIEGSTAAAILSDCSMLTPTQAILDVAGLNHEIATRIDELLANGSDALSPELEERLYDSVPSFSFYSLAVDTLTEACELALSDNPPAAIYDKERDVVADHVAGSGRPVDRDKHDLIRELAYTFKAATGRKATDTESGPFDDFVSACLAVIEGEKLSGTTNRKLIRKALGYVPKPRRKK